jgi:hypothetical protein
MADWVKMRTDLYRDPKVICMSDHLLLHDGDLAKYINQFCRCDMAVTRNVMRNAVVGALVTVWGVARHQGHRENNDLVLENVTFSVIDDIADLPGFGEAMLAVQWLIETDLGLVFPRFFDEHNVDPADSTAQKNRERQRRYRERKRNVTGDVTGDVTVTGRVEREKSKSKSKKESKPKDVDLSGFPENLASAIQGWITYKTERRESYKPQGMKALITQLAKAEKEHGAAAVIDAMELAQASGWKGWAHGLSNGAPKQQERHKKVVYIPKDER